MFADPLTKGLPPNVFREHFLGAEAMGAVAVPRKFYGALLVSSSCSQSITSSSSIFHSLKPFATKFFTRNLPHPTTNSFVFRFIVIGMPKGIL
jgi:hypothetical protein